MTESIKRASLSVPDFVVVPANDINEVSLGIFHIGLEGFDLNRSKQSSG
jgi:hypothetical protein